MHATLDSQVTFFFNQSLPPEGDLATKLYTSDKDNLKDNVEIEIVYTSDKKEHAEIEIVYTSVKKKMLKSKSFTLLGQKMLKPKTITLLPKYTVFERLRGSICLLFIFQMLIC